MGETVSKPRIELKSLNDSELADIMKKLNFGEKNNFTDSKRHFPHHSTQSHHQLHLPHGLRHHHNHEKEEVPFILFLSSFPPVVVPYVSIMFPYLKEVGKWNQRENLIKVLLQVEDRMDFFKSNSLVGLSEDDVTSYSSSFAPSHQNETKIKHTGFSTFQELINSVSFLFYGKQQCLMEFFCCCFLYNAKNVKPSGRYEILFTPTELGLIKLFTFCYLQTVFFQEYNENHPDAGKDAEVNDILATFNLEASAKNSSATQQKFDNFRKGAIWKSLNVNVKNTNSNMCTYFEFRPLIASFRSYVSNPDDISSIVSWIASDLPLLANTCSSSLYIQLLKEEMETGITQKENQSSKKLTYQVYKKDEGDSDEDECTSSDFVVPPVSPSIQQTLFKSRGLRGLWLYNSSRCLTDDLCFALRQRSLEFQMNRWYRLYASWKDGAAFSSFVNALLYYDAPCILVAKSEDGHVFGAGTFSAWKDAGPQFFGNNSNFLFVGIPLYHVYRSTGKQQHFVYVNSKNKFYPKGIGFGGEVGLFRLWIDMDLRHGYATISDSSFQPGGLLVDMNEGDILQSCYRRTDSLDSFKSEFELSELEVWGTGPIEFLKKQKFSRKYADEARLDGRNVDKSKLVESQFDKDFLFGNTFNKNKGPAGFSL